MVNVDLRMVADPKYSNNLKGKSYTLSDTATQRSTVYGDALSTYELEPVKYVRSIVDAAKERMRFNSVVSEYQMPVGNRTFVIPRRTKFMARGDWEASAAEYTTANTDVLYTDITTLDGIQVTPGRHNYGVKITMDAVRSHALNLPAYCRDELAYRYEDKTDSAIRDALLGTVSAATAVIGPVEAADAVTGSQIIFGGDSTNLSDSMDAGDTITTDMVAKARRLLMSPKQYFWSSNVWTKTTALSNPWEGDFVLMIAPEQEEAFLTDSQFTNAAEYGSQEIVLGGEIGKYIGCKVVSTSKMPAFTENDYYYVQGAQYQVDTDGHVCAMFKPGVCGGMVWKQRANFQAFPWPVQDQIRMHLNMEYAASAVQSDAIIRMVVNDA